MNFLNPIILYALGAAALPVIIHLLSRRRTKEVAFPSIEFLERMKTDRMRRLRLKQLLMILLRTLIIVMIILAFARPAVNNVFKKNARTSAVIIIDGSASMMYVHNGEALFAGALRKAREILNILENDDTAAVILSNDVPALIGPGMTADKKKLFEAINELENPLTVSDATKSFAMASDILASSTDPNMEMYYITDYAVNSIPDSLPPLKNFARVYTIRLGPETRSSSVIKQVELKERLLTPGKPVTFQMQGVLGPEENEVNVELFVNGERKMRSLAERRSGDIIETEFSYTPDVTG
ncbi:MAG: VWA domain-containing protein, partial [Candidatus Latescibacteria bacterium]|nr:VWA domain-containing protein [Candidatus Latescibacterota bacterium]